MQFVVQGRAFHCALDVTMHYIGGKWKAVVLWYLKKDEKRFAELRRLMPQITERVLSLQLKQLEADGLVVRMVKSAKPLQVAYALTPFGETLLPALEEVSKWGRKTGTERGRMVAKAELAKRKRPQRTGVVMSSVRARSK